MLSPPIPGFGVTESPEIDIQHPLETRIPRIYVSGMWVTETIPRDPFGNLVVEMG